MASASALACLEETPPFTPFASQHHRSHPGGTPFQSHTVEASVTTTVTAMAEEHARTTWEAMLAYLVGAEAGQPPPPQVITVLVTTGLLAPGQPDTSSQGYGRLISTTGPASGASSEPTPAAPPGADADAGGSLANARLGTLKEIMKSRTVHITKRGYSFLLSDLQVQLWTFVAEYVRSATQASSAVTSAAVLAFLFQMGFCSAGSVYSTRSLDDTQRVILHDLAAFGLVFITGDGSSFTPTSLAMRLVAGRATAASAVTGQKSSDLSLSAAHMAIVVERNMRVYVYTASPLAVDLLRVFVKVDAVMPNLVSGTLTKASVGAALDMGLTAAEVVHFLQCRMHPKMAQDGLRVPDNVADALHAWEAERYRAPMHQAALLEDFDGNDEFEDLMEFLQPSDVLFVPGEAELVDAAPYVIVRLEALQRVAPFLKQRRQQLAASALP